MKPARSESEIDETLEQSFPASDPPSWTLGEEGEAAEAEVEAASEPEAGNETPLQRRAREADVR